MLFNSVEIRRLANEYARCAAALSETANSDVVRAMGLLPDALEGRAAEHLDKTLNDMKKDILKASGEIEEIKASLLRHARRLELADRMAKSIIGR